MKNYALLAAAAIAVMASCSKIQTPENELGNKITFQAASYVPETKADVSVLNDFTSFKCKAFLHADGYESETQEIFGAAETISPDNTTNPTYWAPSRDYYWPKSASSYINFIAWYDEGSVMPTTATETSLSWANYTVATDGNLLFADEAWRYKDNDNPLYNMDRVTKGVPMLFHHALAQLCIKANVAKASEGNTSWDVTLENISLAGAYTTGTLALTNSDKNSMGTKAWTGSWGSHSNATPIAMGNVTTPLTTAAVDVLPMRTVLPQTLGNSHVLSFDYNISYKYNDVEYQHEKISASIKLTDFTGAIAAWEMNKRITYTITINPETTVIRIDPAVVEWENVAGGTTTL